MTLTDFTASSISVTYAENFSNDTEGKNLPVNRQVDRIFMNLKKKLTPGGILTLSSGYIHAHNLYSQTVYRYISRYQVTVYRTIGPLVCNCCLNSMFNPGNVSFSPF